VSRILISAAEASGDRLAAQFVAEMEPRIGSVPFVGIAGASMRTAGVEALAEVEELSVMGFAELLGKLGAILKARGSMRRAIHAGASGLVVVDAPDLNMPLARLAHRRGIPVVFLVSPQVWAWRGARAREISRIADVVLCLFDFEPKYYGRWGGRAEWVGHPVVERVRPSEPGRGYAFLPGSRLSEVQRLLPVMAEVVRMLRQREPDVPIRFGVAEEIGLARMKAMVDALGISDVVFSEGLEAAAAPSAACLVCSGTATLELACMGRPMVVVYKAHRLTWWIGRLWVRGVQHIALPNILLGREAVPEFVQHLEPKVLVECLREASEGTSQRSALADVRARLGEVGAAGRAADCAAAVFASRVSG